MTSTRRSDNIPCSAVCKEHPTIIRQLKFVVTMMGLFLVGVGWSAYAGHKAEQSAQEVKQDFRVYCAGQDEHLRSIEGSVLRIEKRLEKQQEQLESLLRKE